MVSRYFPSSLAVACALAAATSAFAGDGNVLRVIQTSPSGPGVGNSLFVDQSAASGSLLTGPTDDTTSKVLSQEFGHADLVSSRGNTALAATQTGSGNSATITMTGNGGELQLLQDNDSSSTVTQAGNRATVNLDGNALGAVIQIGDNNLAEVDLEAGARGLVAQTGIGNSGELKVGEGGSAELVQNGNLNRYPVQVQPNTTVTVTQNGNGLQPVGVQGVQVFSTNPGTISITQTGF